MLELLRLGGAMDRTEKTRQGFTVRRRCDNCGDRIVIQSDDGDKCLLKCLKCGKEYKFVTCRS